MQAGTAVFLAWLALIAIAGIYGNTCGSSCPSSLTLRALSPRWLAKSIATAGPAPLWLAVIVRQAIQAYQYKGKVTAFAVLRSCAALLAPSVFAFIAVVMPVRYLHYAVGYDPSGHILVIGVQIAPLCVLLNQLQQQVSTSPVSRKDTPSCILYGSLATVFVFAWAWFSFFTAAFFHTILEVIPSALLAVWLMKDTTTCVTGAHTSSMYATLSARATVSLVAWVVAVIVFAATVSLLSAQPPLIASVVYDAVLFGFGCMLVGSVKVEPN